MTALLREVQAAYMLGYQEMADFRAAVKSQLVPGPTRRLKVGRRNVDAWSRTEIQRWIDNEAETTAGYRSLDDSIGELA